MSHFTEIDSSRILMFPLTMGESERSDGGSFSYKSIPENSYWNIIFLDTRTNAYHLLSDKKMLIMKLGTGLNPLTASDIGARK